MKNHLKRAVVCLSSAALISFAVFAYVDVAHADVGEKLVAGSIAKQSANEVNLNLDESTIITVSQKWTDPGLNFLLSDSSIASVSTKKDLDTSDISNIRYVYECEITGLNPGSTTIRVVDENGVEKDVYYINVSSFNYSSCPNMSFSVSLSSSLDQAYTFSSSTTDLTANLVSSSSSGINGVMTYQKNYLVSASVEGEHVISIVGLVDGDTRSYLLNNTHAWDSEYSTDIEPSCTAAGQKSIHCERCGSINTESIEPIPATGHNWSNAYTVDIEPTCTEEGLESIHCEACGEMKEGSAQVIEKLDHQYGNWVVTVEPTCTDSGSREKTCSECGNKVVEEIDATGHSFSDVYSIDKPASCAEEGSESIHCDICGAIKAGSERAIPKVDHSWGEWEIVSAATYDKEGSKTRSCQECGEVEYGTIPTLEMNDISGSEVRGIVKKKYDGNEHVQDVKVTCNGEELVMGEDYAVDYADNLNAGIAKMVIRGIGDYQGVTEREFIIEKRSVTLRSADAQKYYDGMPLANPTIDVSGDGFASGEGAQFEVTGSQTEVGSSSNTFTYILNEGTLADNYEIVCIEGNLTVLSQPIDSWVWIDGKLYYFDSYGYPVTDTWMKNTSDKWVYLGSDGAMITNDFIKDSEETYYVGNDGTMTIDKYIEINGKHYYYFDTNGHMVTNSWVQFPRTSFYFGSDGAQVTDALVEDSDGWCYVDSYGYVISDKWKQIDGKWYYFDNTGHMIKNQWKKDSRGLSHYLGSDGAMVMNKWAKIDGKWYYFYENGTKAVDKWMKDSKGWVYLGDDGAMVTEKWVKDSKGWCYVGSDGYAVKSQWKKDSKGWCYLDENCRLTIGWKKISAKWYYFDSNGRMVASKWIKDSKGWCYVGSNGAMVTNGWAKDSKGWCYMDASGYAIANQWKQIGGKWYYFDANARMVTGTQTINGKTYRFADNGAWLG